MLLKLTALYQGEPIWSYWTIEPWFFCQEAIGIATRALIQAGYSNVQGVCMAVPIT